jgi:hypothetical protein
MSSQAATQHHPDSANPEIISYKQTRRTIGYLALALPVAIAAGYMILSGRKICILDSISEYYYTIMGTFFTGTLCMVGLFLYAYKGYNAWENKVFNAAAFLCVLIAAFPMNPKNNHETFPLIFNNNVLIINHYYIGMVHLATATVLFGILGYVSNNLFTKTQEAKHPAPGKAITPQKLQRNRIYRFCGRLIWVSLGIYALYYSIYYIYRNDNVGVAMDNFPMLFLVETICLWAFGFSWLVKGEGIPFLND